MGEGKQATAIDRTMKKEAKTTGSTIGEFIKKTRRLIYESMKQVKNSPNPWAIQRAILLNIMGPHSKGMLLNTTDPHSTGVGVSTMGPHSKGDAFNKRTIKKKTNHWQNNESTKETSQTTP